MIGNRSRVTVSTIAKAAEVSRATVYAVLNRDNQTNIGLSDATRRKVEEVISRLGYIPNNNARTLVSGRSNNIGLLLVTPGAKFDQQLAREITAAFAPHGYHVITDYHNDDKAEEKCCLMNFYAQNMDAIILCPIDEFWPTELLRQAVKSHIPVIMLCSHHVDEQFYYISFDEVEAMRQILHHAQSSGYCRLGYFYPLQHKFNGEARLSYLRALLPEFPELTLVAADQVEGYQSCRDVLGYYRTLAAPPDFLICFNDRLAIAAMSCAAELNVRIPEELAIVGIDNDNDPYVRPLTSVQLPLDQMAQKCLLCFLDFQQRTEPKKCLQFLDLHPELFIRSSSYKAWHTTGKTHKTKENEK